MPETARNGAPVVPSLVDPRLNDPDGQLVTRAHLSENELDQVVAVLEAMQTWRDLERSMSEAARKYMRLGETDMRALRYLLAANRQGIVTTPGTIAAHLHLSPAAATKLTDRLEAGGHVRRSPHPEDRRRTSIEVTPSTRDSARASVGISHAKRFDAIARLSGADREAVLRFFESLSGSAEWADPDASAPQRA